MSAPADTLTLTGRALRISRRNPDALVTALALPVMLMLLFVHFFGGAIETGDDRAYVTWVVPGVLLLCAGFGCASTAQAVTEDMRNGVVDRFRSLDVGGTAILAAHVAASTVRNVVATTVVLGVALAIGFRPEASLTGRLAAGGVLLAYVVALSWVCAAVGLLVRTSEAAGGFTFFVSFLPYASGAFVPVDSMPSWLQGFATHQPLAPVVESLRALLLDRPATDATLHALLWTTALALTAAAASGPLFRRRTRRP
ncbi:ABC transporter permease [Streptomyces sp. NPDC060194]|uniref:ABC transporter permease n=1 Tax=Streptomyces sp. NPDC060194 TaxID=3347069 RepID=UPI0036551121